MPEKYYIGISTTWHDPAMTIIDDQGEVIFAEATERYLQVKRAIGCPADPVVRVEQILEKYCDLGAEFHIATTWSKGHLRVLKILEELAQFSKRSGLGRRLFNTLFKGILSDHNQLWFNRLQLSSNLKSGSTLERMLRVKYGNSQVYLNQFDHHLTHAAMACYSSAFEEAVCLVVDGSGEKGSISSYRFENGTLNRLTTHKGFESLGFFYAILTELCGFDPLKGEEWKVMGLAPYGEKDGSYYEQLGSLFEVKDLELRFKLKARQIRTLITTLKEEVAQSEDAWATKIKLAYTGQLLFSEYMTQLIKSLYQKGHSDNLVYTGGCALNSAYNGKIAAETGFKHVYIPSAPGDDGCSMGAAYLAYLKNNPTQKIKNIEVQSAYLGSEIPDEEIQQFIQFSGFEGIRHLPDTLCQETARLLSEGKLVGWIQGRAEFGPRALGNRSILADPRSTGMKDKINSRVKFREEFRPFAPSVLHEYGQEYFENYQESPYMERTLSFKDEVTIKVPAVVHKDQTGRLQTVNKERNPKFHQLLSEFHQLTDIPILLNTSFNVMGKPIVHSFTDVMTVFLNSGLDVIAVNDYLFEKCSNGGITNS